MILEEPMAGARGAFAMVGLGEKGCADLKFIARSSGGHASTPGKNTPLVRLGKFMAAVEKSGLFEADISPVVCEMLKRCGFQIRSCAHQLLEDTPAQATTWFIIAQKI